MPSGGGGETEICQSQRVALSVVVGCMNARLTVADCLAALESQIGADMEIIVVDNSTDGSTEIMETQFPNLRLVRKSDCSYIPQLWGIGVGLSRGEIVALTTAHCVLATDWIAQIQAAHTQLQEPVVGIGGAIENDARCGIVDWAVYFCRYAAFAPPFTGGLRHDIAGDNASYRKSAIVASESAWRDGFWEPDVHAQMQTAGGLLAVTPDVVTTHRHSYGFFAFLWQRLQHGFQYGSSRAGRELRGARRFLYILVGSLIPLLLLRRTVVQIGRKGRYTGKLLLCMQILLCFFIAWSLGEWSGYILPDKDSIPEGDS